MARLRFCPGSDKKLTAPFKPAKMAKRGRKKKREKWKKGKKRTKVWYCSKGLKKRMDAPKCTNTITRT